MYTQSCFKDEGKKKKNMHGRRKEINGWRKEKEWRKGEKRKAERKVKREGQGGLGVGGGK